MSRFKDFCSTNPEPCTKNLNIPRINMPQITNKKELLLFTKICNSIGYKTNYVTLKNVDKHKIYTSQKEINESIARKIPIYQKMKKSDIPVIMIYSEEEDEYMIVDGHHRWLAHHLKGGNLKILKINIGKNDLKSGFFKIIRKLKKNKKNKSIFFKKFSIKGNRVTKKTKRKNKRKTKKLILSNKDYK